MLTPPMFTKQNFVRVTSINLAGSQNDMGIPIRGTGLPQLQIIWRGLPVSSLPGDTRSPPIVMGNRQLQHMSVMGFTNLPLHFAKHSREKIIAKIIKPLSKPSNSEEFLGAYGAQDRSVLEVREDPSTGATRKLPEGRRLRKRSISFFMVFPL
jgi:hypothetical protein